MAKKEKIVYLSSGAEISECQKYRFKLWRIWDESKPFVLWIMHNPSTADGEKDDNTIRRIVEFSKSWGYGGLYVGNLFSYRAKDPKDLLGKEFSEIAPMEGIRHTNEMRRHCSLKVFAYGNPVIKDAVPTVFDLDWNALKLTKAGNPCHPLYLKADLKPVLLTTLLENHEKKV